jgi:hypothetical protein
MENDTTNTSKYRSSRTADTNFGANLQQEEISRDAPDIRLAGHPAFLKIRCPAGYRI